MRNDIVLKGEKMSVEFLSFENAVTNQNANNGVFARFYDKAVKTGNVLENGLPEVEKKLYIEIRVRDQRDVFDQPATVNHINRFATEYNRYLNQKEKLKKGTPLEMFAFLSADQVESCHFRGIYCVEDLANIADVTARNLNISEEKNLAIDFLKASKNNQNLMLWKKKEKEYLNEIQNLKLEIERLKDHDSK